MITCVKTKAPSYHQLPHSNCLQRSNLPWNSKQLIAAFIANFLFGIESNSLPKSRSEPTDVTPQHEQHHQQSELAGVVLHPQQQLGIQQQSVGQRHNE